MNTSFGVYDYSDERRAFEDLTNERNARNNLINNMKNCKKQKSFLKLLKNISKRRETEEKEVGRVYRQEDFWPDALGVRGRGHLIGDREDRRFGQRIS